MACIALLTDFGERDGFAGTLKGVIASIHPEARVIDISHGIPRGDIRKAAVTLMAAHAYFPKGTIFLAVVDPGVGGPRAPVLIESGGRYYVGPDNGIFSYALKGRKRTVRLLENPALRLPGVGNTFHGRDIFAPAAAHLCLGQKPAAFGRRKRSLLELPWPRVIRRGNALRGTVIYVDGFGNAISNIPASRIRALRSERLEAEINGRKIPMKAFYAETPPGKALALTGSCGFLEIAVNQGDAAKELGLKIGDAVSVVAAQAGRHKNRKRPFVILKE